jgi:BlaI family transcriptional regulator, penicillinase repressor
MANFSISDAEWQVMQVVWNRKTTTAADVITELSQQTGWSHRTIRTLLARLVEKTALSTQPEGNRYVYRPLVTRRQCVREAGRSFLDRVFEGDCGELLMHFARQGKIAPAQIDKLRQLLDEQQDAKD